MIAKFEFKVTEPQNTKAYEQNVLSCDPLILVWCALLPNTFQMSIAKIKEHFVQQFDLYKNLNTKPLIYWYFIIST